MRQLLLIALLLLTGCTRQQQQATVTRIVDGDTIVVHVLGREEKVRLIGVDTPEIVDPQRPVGCFGAEASEEMKRLLPVGSPVILRRKPDEDRDKYNRLLRYIMLGDQDVGAVMIRDGYAKSYEIFPHPLLAQYHALQEAAKVANIGLWKQCVPAKKKGN